MPFAPDRQKAHKQDTFFCENSRVFRKMTVEQLPPGAMVGVPAHRRLETLPEWDPRRVPQSTQELAARRRRASRILCDRVHRREYPGPRRSTPGARRSAPNDALVILGRKGYLLGNRWSSSAVTSDEMTSSPYDVLPIRSWEVPGPGLGRGRETPRQFSKYYGSCFMVRPGSPSPYARSSCG
jgi:hypothetical protein